MESSNNRGDNTPTRYLLPPSKTASSARNGLNLVGQYKINSVVFLWTFAFFVIFDLTHSYVFAFFVVVVAVFMGLFSCFLFLKEKKNIRIGG